MNSLLGEHFRTMTFSHHTVKCVKCEKEFELSFKLNRDVRKIDELRKHLILEHQLIISDINDIDDLNGYLWYWRKRMKDIVDLKTICALIKTNTKPEDTGEKMDFYMLCADVLPEDQNLREELNLAKLNHLIEVQEEERKDNNFERNCLFCRKTICGNRSDLFTHLNEVHNLKLGNPNNIVFVKEFLDLIESKLNQHICLYCERNFKDRQVLKEHMRKKMHKHLNPHSKEYDEFYLINYLKTNAKWYKCKKANESDEEDSETYDDWVEICNEKIKCLFCENDQASSISEFENHLFKIHLFDFSNLKPYSFYQKVQIINFIRSCTEKSQCMNCDQKFESIIALCDHLVTDNHNTLPLKHHWNNEQYYRPVIENDTLLRLIDTDED